MAQALHHAGVFVEAEDHVAKQVGRRLITRNQQQAAEAEQFHVAQALSIDLSGQQSADQVVLRMLAALLKALCEVAIHALDLLDECLALLLPQASVPRTARTSPPF